MRLAWLWPWRRRRTLDKVRRFANLGAESSFNGELAGHDNYVVYGKVRGDGDLQGSLVLKAGGHWKGNIQAANIIIAGEVDGDVTASVKVDLLPTARVHGVVAGPLIAVAQGAEYGKIRTSKKTRIVRYTERRGGPAGGNNDREVS